MELEEQTVQMINLLCGRMDTNTLIIYAIWKSNQKLGNALCIVSNLINLINTTQGMVVCINCSRQEILSKAHQTSKLVGLSHNYYYLVFI
uniref:Uncharacterized protein n=1 Tax=Pyxicephalus adspersus TaxID=30357 RepID=A0AAV3A4W4_PYXAD|nr:TPA: hypothetical protein GDO54_018208 [Pyxicephalus adspersus]